MTSRIVIWLRGFRKSIACREVLGPPTILAAALVTFPCLQVQAAEGPAKRAFTHDQDVPLSSVWTNLPRWEGETLVGYDNNFSSGPIIYTIDRQGRRDETLFTLQDAAGINIVDVAGSLHGEIAIIGSAVTADTRGATFLTRIGTNRTRQTVTRTWPYCPSVVTFAPDGTIWTIGHLKDLENTRTLAKNVLRRFDRSGKMLGSVTLQIKGWGTAETSYLRASRDRVGWFTRRGEYIEFSLDGSEIARYDWPEGAEERDISGVAMSQNNDVIAGRFGKGRAEFDVLDRESRTWVAASVPKDHAPAWAWVLGFDGTTVVTYNSDGGLRHLSRFRVE